MSVSEVISKLLGIARARKKAGTWKYQALSPTRSATMTAFSANNSEQLKSVPNLAIDGGARKQSSISTMVIVFLLGSSIGPGLFFAVDNLDSISSSFISFVVGFFVAVGMALSMAAFAALILIPRALGNVTGTLDNVINSTAAAWRANSEGRSADATEHLGQAASEASAWYLSYRTRQFVSQASIGLRAEA